MTALFIFIRITLMPAADIRVDDQYDDLFFTP